MVHKNQCKCIVPNVNSGTLSLITTRQNRSQKNTKIAWPKKAFIRQTVHMWSSSV